MQNKKRETYVYRIDNVPHGLNQGIDTGVLLSDVDKNWTILCDIAYPGATLQSNGSYAMRGTILDCGIVRDNATVASAVSPICFGIFQNYANCYWMEGRKYVYNSSELDFINPESRRYAFWHNLGETYAHINLCGSEYTTATKNFVANNNHLYIRYSVNNEFLINQVLIYTKSLTATEISNYITNGIIP